MSAEEKRPLPEGWIWSRVQDVAEINYGKGLPKRDRNDRGEFPVYGSNGIVGYHDHAITKDPCLIIGRKGAAGALHLSSSGCWPIDTTYYAFFNEDIDLKYAYYALGILGLEELDRSTAIPSLSRDDLYSQYLPIAPLPEQKRIVAEIEKQFTRLDTAVSSLKRAQANLARYKASVLKAACEGRLVPQDPGDEAAEKLLQRILAERRKTWEEEEWAKLVEKAQKKAAQSRHKAHGRPARLSDLAPEEWHDIPESDYASYLPKNDKWKQKYKEPAAPDTAELPPLPDGWVWVNISQLSTKVTDGVHKTPQYVNEGIPFISVNNMDPDGGIDFTSCKYITRQEHQELFKRCDPEEGDILLSKVGTVGLTAVIKTDKEFSLFVNTALIKPVNQSISSQYIALALRHGFMSKKYASLVTGSTQKFIGTTKIGTLTVPFPPLAEQIRIVEEAERRLSFIAVNEKAIAADLTRAESLRQSILQQAFSGRLV